MAAVIAPSQLLFPDYPSMTLPPLTLTGTAGSGLGAGPATTDPFVMLYWLP
jgi:hypothetical protein